MAGRRETWVGDRLGRPLHSTRDYLVAWVGTLNDPAMRPALAIAGVLVAIGTAFYALVERWTVLDALYFSVVTLATVGYGDLAPRTAAGKLFTMAYIVLGVSTLAAILAVVVRGAARRVLDVSRLPVGATSVADAPAGGPAAPVREDAP